MASKQTRRSISVTGESYRRFAAYCATRGASMSSLVEAHILALVDGIADPGGLPPQRRAEVVTLTCAQCGKTFERQKARQSPGAINAFCSSAHRNAWQIAERQVERAREALAKMRAAAPPRAPSFGTIPMRTIAQREASIARGAAAVIPDGADDSAKSGRHAPRVRLVEATGPRGAGNVRTW